MITNKKITPKELFDTLKKRVGTPKTLKDLPPPSSLKDLGKAVDRIVDAINKKEIIGLCGDYDVDGQTSTAILKMFFKEIGYPLYAEIPDRFKDGYGLSPSVIERLDGCSLILTVDNGISAVEAGEICKQKGIDLIVTDHHTVPPVVPEAYAIVNPKQEECKFPFKEICGAQVAWYLVMALRKKLNIEIDVGKYLAISTLGTIADMMPLHDINRPWTKQGLKIISTSNLPAFVAFRELIEKSDIRSEDIAFNLAPMMNSSGRLEHASLGMEFLLSADILEARSRLAKLKTINERRKSIESSIVEMGMREVNDSDSLIVCAGEGWHEGVIGIAAARIGRKFKKPCIVLSSSENDPNIYKGSGRSFDEVDLFGVVSECTDILEKFGGHPSAIGMSIKKENLEEFKVRVNQIVKERRHLQEKPVSPIIGELSFSDINVQLIDEIERYGPFGQGNPSPEFVATNVELIEVFRMGSDKNHIRFKLRKDDTTMTAVKFKTKEEINESVPYDFIYKLNKNTYNGETTVQLLVEENTQSNIQTSISHDVEKNESKKINTLKV